MMGQNRVQRQEKDQSVSSTVHFHASENRLARWLEDFSACPKLGYEDKARIQ